MNKRSAFLAYLQSVANRHEDSLEKFVANEALDRDDSVEKWFQDLQAHGCVSGMVSGLVYYSDTEKFFDKHYEEILDIKEAYEDNLGEPMKIEYQLKNHLTWFAFEITAAKLYAFYENLE